jgi:tripartite-type tricarboxylate transporter receptor subunit TctC
MRPYFVLAASAVLGAALVLATGVHAQEGADFPSRAVKIIVNVPAGGGVDATARVLAEKLQHRWGKPVIAENRVGAGGNIGAEAVAVAEPDGYTLLASAPATFTVNAALYKKLNYDPSALEPVAIMALSPNVLSVRATLPVKTARDLIAFAKANPEKLIYASQGNGTTSHLTSELLASQIGTKLVHVPYKGTAPALNDLVAGHVDLMVSDLGSVLPLHEAGKVRIIAVTTAKRVASLPDIPTLDESGIAGFQSTTWYGLAAPAKTPAEIIAKLNAEITAIMSMPDVQERYRAMSIEPDPSNPKTIAAFVAAERTRWSEVISAAHITLE